jgi:hypothetical protein
MSVCPLGLDPSKSAPAIIRPAGDIGDEIAKDRIATLVAEVISLGKTTAQNAVATGKKIDELYEECLRQNGGKPGLWLKTCKQHKINHKTAKRLRTKYKNALSHQLDTESNSLEAIYDDGQPAEDTTNKKVCRQCRITGRGYQKDCRACKALNRPVPTPKEDRPLIDGDGKPIPDHLKEIWLDAEQLRAFGRQFTGLGKAIAGLAERPSGSRIKVDSFIQRLKEDAQILWSFRPGYLCHVCHGDKCESCDNRGWFSHVEVQIMRTQERAAEWKAKQAAANKPATE